MANTKSEQSDTDDNRQESREGEQKQIESRRGRSWTLREASWSSEPDVGRVANGIPGRAHRLKGLGNAVVPKIPEEIGKAIWKVLNQKLRILSLGAGVQSSTMALMADAGEFGIKPDATVFADTGWEPKPVIKHLEYLKSVISYPIHIVKKGNIQDDILTALAPGGNQFASAPFYTLNEQGKKGMGRRQCTREYKITPIAKKIRELCGLKPRQRFPKTEHVEVWVGISTDEVMRMKPSRFWWQKNDGHLLKRKCQGKIV